MENSKSFSRPKPSAQELERQATQFLRQHGISADGRPFGDSRVSPKLIPNGNKKGWTRKSRAA